MPVDWPKVMSKEAAEMSNCVCHKPTVRLGCLKLKISGETAKRLGLLAASTLASQLEQKEHICTLEL